MNILHHTSPCMLHLGNSELNESVFNSMSCVSVPMGFVLQTPAFGVASGVKTKREQKHPWVLVSRRCSFVRNAFSAAQIEAFMVVKEDTGFKSSFGEYLKAMESVRDEREKENVQRGSGRRNKQTDAAFRKDVSQHQKGSDTTKSKWFRRLDSKEEDERFVRSRKDVPQHQKCGDTTKSRSFRRLDLNEEDERFVRLRKDVPQHQKRSDTNKSRSFRRFGSKEENERFVRSRKDVPQHQKRSDTTKFKSFRRLDSKEEDVRSWKDVSQHQKRNDTSKSKSFTRLDLKEEDERFVWSRKDVSRHQKHSDTTKYKSFRRLDSKEEDERFVRLRKDVPQHQKRSDTTKFKSFRRLDSKEEDERFVRSRKDVPQHQKHSDTPKSKWFRRLDSKGDYERFVRSDVVGKEKIGGGVQTRYSVRSQDELHHVGSKNGLSTKVDVHTAVSKSPELIKKKFKPTNKKSVNDEMEMDKFIFQPNELSNEGLDVPRVSQMEMEERIQKLAICLNDADVDMPEWMFAKTMRSARIRFSDHSMLRIIQILGKFQNWQRVLQLIEWLQMQERYVSHKIRYVYTAALDVLRKARRPVEALNLFYTMQRHKTTYPDIVTYRSIAVTLGQAGYVKELFDVIDSMRSMPKNFNFDTLDDWDPRLEPDIVIYNAVLNGCVKRKEWEGAVWVLQKLKEIGQQPSSTTYGLVMEVMLACGKYDLVHEYFKLMQRSSVPNALAYRVVVNTLWSEGKPDEAIATVQDMENRGIIGSASLYYDLARCLCSVGRCEEGLMQVDKICKVASKPLVVTYTGLLQACIGNGNIHDAASIFNHMQKYCSPNTVTFNIMLKAYLGYGMFEEARELFHKMTQSGQKDSKVKSGIRPDLHTFNTMLEACIREKRWDDFEDAYEKMLQQGHPFNTKRHLWMILQASAAGKVGTIETTWRHLVHSDRVPPPALVKERFKVKMESDNLVEAVSSIARHPSTHQKSFSKEAWLQLLKDNAHRFKKEALDRLIYEVRNCLSISESPNLIYQNLLDSCMEICKA